MSDIALTLAPDGADFSLLDGDLVTDGGLQGAVAISLFSDRRADPADPLPVAGDLRGWWGDAFNERRIGSRLWLIAREKRLPDALRRAREYAEESLAWLIDTGVASRVDVVAEQIGAAMLGLTITILRETREPLRYRYTFAWEGFASAVH